MQDKKSKLLHQVLRGMLDRHISDTEASVVRDLSVQLATYLSKRHIQDIADRVYIRNRDRRSIGRVTITKVRLKSS